MGLCNYSNSDSLHIQSKLILEVLGSILMWIHEQNWRARAFLWNMSWCHNSIKMYIASAFWVQWSVRVDKHNYPNNLDITCECVKNCIGWLAKWLRQWTCYPKIVGPIPTSVSPILYTFNQNWVWRYWVRFSCESKNKIEEPVHLCETCRGVTTL